MEIRENTGMYCRCILTLFVENSNSDFQTNVCVKGSKFLPANAQCRQPEANPWVIKIE